MKHRYALLGAATGVAIAAGALWIGRDTAGELIAAARHRSHPLCEIISLESADRLHIAGLHWQVVPPDPPRGHEVRLLGLAAPNADLSVGPVESFAAESLAFATDLVKTRKVWVEEVPRASKQDSTPREYLTLYRFPDGVCINDELVHRGWARTSGASGGENLERLKGLEAGAKRSRRGIWAAPQ